jgi:hypothetical protein
MHEKTVHTIVKNFCELDFVPEGAKKTMYFQNLPSNKIAKNSIIHSLILLIEYIQSLI